MIGNRLLSPCLLQNPATSFQPPIASPSAFAWNSKRQYQILTRSWSSLDSSYTVRSIGRNIEQTLARKSRYRPHISANLFHDPRVFDFTSSFPFRQRGSQQSKETGAGWSIDSRTRYIYANNLGDALCNFRNPFRTRGELRNNFNSERWKDGTRKSLWLSIDESIFFSPLCNDIDLSINSSSAHSVPRINAARSIQCHGQTAIYRSLSLICHCLHPLPSRTLNLPLEPR